MIPARARSGGIELHVRLTPKSSRDAIEGVAEASDGSTHLKARVRAVPEKGRANAALEALVAGWLKVPSGTVSVIAGGTSRLKTVSISGDPGELIRRVTETLEGG